MERLSTLEKVLFLKHVGLFADLHAKELASVAQDAEELEFARGHVVFKESDTGDALYLIMRGSAAVLKGDDESRSIVSILGEKECFGEMSVLSDEPRAATVEALEPLRVLRISRDVFRAVVLRYPHVAFSVFQLLIRRLRTITQKYHELPLLEAAMLKEGDVRE